jgi:hypothetical protein
MEMDDLDYSEINKYLPSILYFFVLDVNAMFNKDPATRTLIEVLTSYPGIKAVLLYRIAHFFWKLRLPYIPRYISSIARDLTAVEIHPGAEILYQVKNQKIDIHDLYMSISLLMNIKKK